MVIEIRVQRTQVRILALEYIRSHRLGRCYKRQELSRMEKGSLAMIFINIARDKTNSEKGKNSQMTKFWQIGKKKFLHLKTIQLLLNPMMTKAYSRPPKSYSWAQVKAIKLAATGIEPMTSSCVTYGSPSSLGVNFWGRKLNERASGLDDVMAFFETAFDWRDRTKCKQEKGCRRR